MRAPGQRARRRPKSRARSRQKGFFERLVGDAAPVAASERKGAAGAARPGAAPATGASNGKSDERHQRTRGQTSNQSKPPARRTAGWTVPGHRAGRRSSASEEEEAKVVVFVEWVETAGQGTDERQGRGPRSARRRRGDTPNSKVDRAEGRLVRLAPGARPACGRRGAPTQPRPRSSDTPRRRSGAKQAGRDRHQRAGGRRRPRRGARAEDEADVGARPAARRPSGGGGTEAPTAPAVEGSKERNAAGAAGRRERRG